MPRVILARRVAARPPVTCIYCGNLGCASGSRDPRDRCLRYLDIHEGDHVDGAQLAAWVKQASKLPGEDL